MKYYKNQTKIVVGDDAIDRIGYEIFYHNCVNALVIYDTTSEICGAKKKLKKILKNSESNVCYLHLNVDKVPTYLNVKISYDALIANKADYIICLGTDVVADIGKAVKALVCTENTSFEGVSKLNFVKNDLKLIVVATSAGNWHNLMHGNFIVYDEKKENLYKLRSKHTCPDAVIVDTHLLDKLSETTIIENELATIFMSFVSLLYSKTDTDKIYALTALDTVGKSMICKDTLTEKQTVTALMYAGQSFLNIKRNILEEFVCQAQLIGEIKYTTVMVNLFRNCIDDIVSLLEEEQIEWLGNTFEINLIDNTKEQWHKKMIEIINNNFDKYFSDCNVVRGLNANGLTPQDAGNILNEIAENSGQYSVIEKFIKFKEIVYNSL